jgi:hypothetical protein
VARAISALYHALNMQNGKQSEGPMPATNIFNKGMSITTTSNKSVQDAFHPMPSEWFNMTTLALLEIHHALAWL